MLFLVGLGLSDEKDLSLRGLEIVKAADRVYLEEYTSPFLGSLKKLEKVIKKKVILADREVVESKIDDILDAAKKKDVVFLLVGDVFAATTHIDIILRARKKKIKVKIIHNASILTAVAETGLSLYKFGKIASIPFGVPGWKVESPYNLLKENKNAHTLFLLDLHPKEKKFMSFSQAIEFLLNIEGEKKENRFTEETLCIGCAALGSEKQKIVVGAAKEVMKEKVSIVAQCLIVPGELHFVEKEALDFYRI